MRKSKAGKGTPKRKHGATKRKTRSSASTPRPRLAPGPGPGLASLSTPDFGPPLSPLGMEKAIADMTRTIQSQNFSTVEEINEFLSRARPADLVPPEPATPLERAQNLMYEAWDAAGPRRLELARQALAVSPACSDAYMLLAEESATSTEEARRFYEQAVAAGERALGAETFEQNAGHFWGAVETRPYMRARAALAHVLWTLGERDRAVEHFEDMLRLNPNDNQGIRYVLAQYLMTAGDLARLGSLLDRYDEDAAAEWLYTRALWAFRVHGEGDEALAALAKALEWNPIVVPYLFGVWELPEDPPEQYSPRGEDEAALYVGYCGEHWDNTPGAMEWFGDYVERMVTTTKTKGATKGRSRKSRTKKAAPSSGTVYQLKITLRHVTPPIWRRLLIEPDTSLSALHEILQVSMGWTDSHLHVFRAGRLQFGQPDPDFPADVIDERGASVRTLLPRARSKSVYEYDFGDGWEHEIVVEKILDAEPSASYPACVAGMRACPPEDCGGPGGYADLVEAIRDPDHLEHEELLEWAGEDFDPESFDAARINAGLAKLRR